MNDQVEVRRLASGEWERLREIRLEALEDTPAAYTTTLAEARAFPQSLWRERARASGEGGGQVTIIGVRGQDTVAMAVGLDRRGVVVPIVSVYVSPRVRGCGVGRRIMAEVEEWARARGGEQASLWVVDSNSGARAFYEAIGYRATLDRQKIPVPPPRWETRMVKDLTRR